MTNIAMTDSTTEVRPQAAGIAPAADADAIELCIVVPTFNESGNVEELVKRVRNVMAGHSWELIFVDDDSPDRTASRVYQIARTDRRVRCIHRIGRRGLSSACIEGMLASPAPYIAVMDADLQHDESILPKMLGLLTSQKADLVVGSRYTEGGGTGNWDSKRESMSRFATKLSQLISKQPVSDPMSGFFMMRREVLENTVRSLSKLGFKILLDIVATSKNEIRIAEVPYTFRTRLSGESKLDSAVLWEFGMLLADKAFGRYIPVRFVSFAAVGGAGVLIHVAILTLLHQALALPFATGQTGATISTMVFNFWLNNLLTYRDRQLKGWRWLTGLGTFMLACSVGALANVGIAAYLFDNDTQWLAAALAGVVVGAVWNFAITQLYTWGKPKS